MKFAKLTDLHGHVIYVSPYLMIRTPLPGEYGSQIRSVITNSVNIVVREAPDDVAHQLEQLLQLELIPK
jgi:hypothetical protein